MNVDVYYCESVCIVLDGVLLTPLLWKVLTVTTAQDRDVFLYVDDRTRGLPLFLTVFVKELAICLMFS
jgi:hypothetical protein